MRRWKITFTNGEENFPSIFGDFFTFAEAAALAYLKKQTLYKGFKIHSISSQGDVQ